MSGIAGIYKFNSKKDVLVEELNSMIDTFKYRGNDKIVWTGEKIGLAHRQSESVTSRCNYGQTLINDEERVLAVCDGIIFNYKELKKYLVKKGNHFKTHSIAELIVRLYCEDGVRFIEQLEGAFALALWDQDKEKLILARDKMGTKPLFYAIDKGNFIFASEIKGILSNKVFTKDINFESLYFYFFSNGVPSNETLFRNIFRVLHGEMVIVDCKGGLSRRRYWRPEYKNKLKDANFDENANSENLLELAKDSLNPYKDFNNLSLGIALSGGLDSTALVALMSEFFPGNNLNTFSLRFKGERIGANSELANARKVSKIFKTNHVEFSMSYRDLLRHIDDVVEGLDLPFCCWGMNFFLSRNLKKYVCVILEGNGIEEYFGGYWNHRIALSLLKNKTERYKRKLSRQAKKKLLLNYFFILHRRSWDVPFSYNFLGSDANNLFQSPILAEFNKYDLTNSIEKEINKLTANDFLNNVLEWDASVLLHTNAMEINDLSVVHSIETYYPFLNYRIVELALSLPGSLKFKDGWDKYIWRKALEPIIGNLAFLPIERGFMPPIEKWLLAAPVKKWVRDVLSSKRMNRHKFFNSKFVNQLISEHYREEKRRSALCYQRSIKSPDETNHAIKIWKLIMFQLWWEKYFYKF